MKFIYAVVLVLLSNIGHAQIFNDEEELNQFCTNYATMVIKAYTDAKRGGSMTDRFTNLYQNPPENEDVFKLIHSSIVIGYKLQSLGMTEVETYDKTLTICKVKYR